MATVQVQVNQVGSATAEGIIRNQRVLMDRPEAKGGDDRTFLIHKKGRLFSLFSNPDYS